MQEPRPGAPVGAAPTRVLSVADVAGVLEQRVYGRTDGPVEVAEGCREAVAHGVPTMLCRPEHVPVAVEALHGTDVVVGSAVDFHDPATPPLTGDALLAAADRLVADGAGDIGLIAGAARLADRRTLEKDITGLVEAAAGAGVRARVVVDAKGLAREQLREAAQVSAAAGVWLIQCGSWRGDKTRFDWVVDVREALAPEVLVKWTRPVRSLDLLLLALAEGVDRFNADTSLIVRQAQSRAQAGGIRVPQPGTAY